MTSARSDSANDAALEALRARVRGTNINETTLLATDYLNHFNEIVMLLGMVPDMPEMIEDCKAWRPKGYIEHFTGSGVPDADLAVEAFGHVPARYLRPFETTVDMLNATVAAIVARAGAAIENGNPEVVRGVCGVGAEALQRLIDSASAVIHGSEETANREQIDRILAGA